MTIKNDKIKLIFQHDDGNKLLKKTDITAGDDYDYSIGIGDSFTDKHMVQAVDSFSAGDVLDQYLDKLRKKYRPYPPFNVINRIEEIL